MATLIEPIVVPSPGAPPKTIAEFVGRVSTRTDTCSVAVMESPAGWTEPGQRPAFDEYTVVLSGELTVETEAKTFVVRAGQGIVAPAGEWVRYATPADGGAHYVSVCVPAFSPETVNRDRPGA
jgi:quercetin dioxygenase-like cupin family protein